MIHKVIKNSLGFGISLICKNRSEISQKLILNRTKVLSTVNHAQYTIQNTIHDHTTSRLHISPYWMGEM